MRRFAGMLILAALLGGCADDAVTNHSRGSITGGVPTRTPWQMHLGLGQSSLSDAAGALVQFTCAPTQHGAPCEYDVAVIPPSMHAGWGPAPNGDTIGFDVSCAARSLVCQAPGGRTCLAYGDFSYFQTMVEVPSNVVVTAFTITFSGMDDGSRITIFNSRYPTGIVVAGSYVFLGGSGTSNLRDYVVSGEVNRVVVTQVDDCCCENHLHEARVVLNGEEVLAGCQNNAACDDGNACTADVCNADGSCAHTPVSCEDGNACTIDACNASTGCEHAARACNDGDACTADFCDVATGCGRIPVSCDDNNACTADRCDAATGCGHTAISCDDGDACTADFCDPIAGCGHTAVSCDDGNACTADMCNPTSGCGHTTVSCDDGNACTRDTCDPTTGCASVNQCPDCSHAAPSVATLWPPNHRLLPLGVTNVDDPQGQTTTIRIDRIAQDEPTNGTGDGDTCPDADGIGTSTAQVRAERAGTRATPGNGRVYHVYFTATDPDGYACTGHVTSCVPHDQGGRATCVDDGPRYDSLVCR